VAIFDCVHWYIWWCTLVHSVVYTGSYRWRHSVVYTATFDGVHGYIHWCTLDPIGGDIRLCTLVHSVEYTCKFHEYIRSCTLDHIGGDIRLCTLTKCRAYQSIVGRWPRILAPKLTKVPRSSVSRRTLMSI
jgi:hypothetical protein